jgi:membrane protease YdiL (CAAX protease family)
MDGTTSVQPAAHQGSGLALCGLMGALAFGLLPIATWLVQGDSLGKMLAREAIWWCFAAAILLWLTLAERLPPSSIGFRAPTWKSVAFGILAAVVTTAIMVVCFTVIVRALHLSLAAALAQQQAILRTPFWYRVLLVLRAAVVEEILFRGYLIEKVRQLSGNTPLAVVISIVAFSLAHLRAWGPAQLIAVSAVGTVLALLYVWRRDLPSNMFCHFLTDAAGFLRP